MKAIFSNPSITQKYNKIHISFTFLLYDIIKANTQDYQRSSDIMFRFGPMERFGHMGFNSFWGGGGFMMFFWVIILAAVIYFIIQKSNENKNYNQRNNNHYNNQQLSSNYRDSAEETARLRYAKGEISKEEFDEIIRNLRR
jgi:putative membrane protein